MPDLALQVDFVPSIDEVRKRLMPKRTRAGVVPWVVSLDLEGWMVDMGISLARRTQRFAPKDTHRLERSIGFAWTGDGSIEVKAGAPYALYVEEDTAAHWPPPGALAGWAQRHNVPEFPVARSIAEHGTVGQHFMADAWDAERKAMPARIRKLGNAIEARWARGGLMATLGQVRDDLALRLSKIGGLATWARVPDSIEPPVALVGMPEEGLFNVTYGPNYTFYTIPVRLYVSRFDAEVAQEALDEYVAPTGVMSVKRAIEDKTVATTSEWLMVNVSGVRGFGSYPIANVDYLGCEFTVEVIA